MLQDRRVDPDFFGVRESPLVQRGIEFNLINHTVQRQVFFTLYLVKPQLARWPIMGQYHRTLVLRRGFVPKVHFPAGLTIGQHRIAQRLAEAHYADALHAQPGTLMQLERPGQRQIEAVRG